MKTERQYDALRLIYDYFKKNGYYPSNLYMAKMLKIDVNKWGNTRRWMISHKKLVESVTGDFELHPDVLESFRQKEQQFSKLMSKLNQEKSAAQLPLPEKQNVQPAKMIPQEKSAARSSGRDLGPTDISIFGTVNAGTDLGPDDVWVDMKFEGEILTIPDIDLGQDVYALEVSGKSMVSDGILPQDYIIVEKVDIGQIKVGDLIVALYLKKKFNRVSKSKIDDILAIRENYKGPTVKYLIKMEEGKGYTLAPKNRDRRYTIETRGIKADEIGRVVSVHRLMRRL